MRCEPYNSMNPMIFSTPLTHALTRGLAMVFVLVGLAACGASADTPVDATGDATGDTGSAGFAPSGAHWLTGLSLGGDEGNVAHATPVVLADGSTATLEELADGRPLLLYFYATW